MSAIRLVDTRGMEREEWLSHRRFGIGGSDAAAIAGLNPWRSPVQVYMEKTGQVPAEEVTSEAAYWGTRLEDLVAREFTRRACIRAQRCNAILQHPEHPFMIANIDRRIVGSDEGPGVLECKTASAYAREDWAEDKVPPYHLIQVQHYLAVTGYSYGYIAVLLGGREFRHARIDRDEELIAHLIEIEEEFWQRVESHNPPPFDGSEASGELLKRMYPEADPELIIDLPAEASLLVTEHEVAKAEEKAAGERAEAAANRLKALMAEASLGRIDDRIVAWKSIMSNRFDSKAFQVAHPDLHAQFTRLSSYRRFSITGAKE